MNFARQLSKSPPGSHAIPTRPRLLISVRNSAEAKLVAALPRELLDLIGVTDLKEPDRGSLGAADSKTAQQFLRSGTSDRMHSAALGELFNGEAERTCTTISSEFDFAKIGLSQTNSIPDWRVRWKNALERLPESVGRVAVAYLDYQQCGAPAPEAVIEHAETIGCRGVLFDTFDKTRGCFLDWTDEKVLRHLIRKVHQRGQFSVLAGSINNQNLTNALRLRPTLIGVRGAVCAGDRARHITQETLTAFCRAFKTAR